MTDATIDENGEVRVHPDSRASLRVVREPGGWLVITNLGDHPVLMNGDGVIRHGQDRFYLAPGKLARFPLGVATAV